MYTLKYKELNHIAKHIDRLIEARLEETGGHFIPQETIKAIVLENYPDFYVVSFGWHKIVFANRLVDQKVVLKVGPHKTIENDHHVYKSPPKGERHKVFARIFWHTKYCLLQEYGLPAKVSPQQLTLIRREVNKYGIFDVKAENLRLIEGKLRIIDANVTRVHLPTVLRKIDEVKPKIPKKLNTILREITKKFYEK